MRLTFGNQRKAGRGDGSSSASVSETCCIVPTLIGRIATKFPFAIPAIELDSCICKHAHGILGYDYDFNSKCKPHYKGNGVALKLMCFIPNFQCD